MPGTAATGGMRKEPQPVLINGASFEATGRALGRWSLSVAPLDLLDIGRSSGARARSPLSLPPSFSHIFEVLSCATAPLASLQIARPTSERP